MASSFNGVAFELPLPNGDIIDQVPFWDDRDAGTNIGTLELSITGRVAIQEFVRSWKPLTLEFAGAGRQPQALMTQPMLDAFRAAQDAGGLHTLILEGLTKTVAINWMLGPGWLSKVEVTPTGETAASDRLYTGAVNLIEVLT